MYLIKIFDVITLDLYIIFYNWKNILIEKFNEKWEKSFNKFFSLEKINKIDKNIISNFFNEIWDKYINIFLNKKYNFI